MAFHTSKEIIEISELRAIKNWIQFKKKNILTKYVFRIIMTNCQSLYSQNTITYFDYVEFLKKKSRYLYRRKTGPHKALFDHNTTIFSGT